MYTREDELGASIRISARHLMQSEGESGDYECQLSQCPARLARQHLSRLLSALLLFTCEPVTLTLLLCLNTLS